MRANACGVDFGTSNSTVGWLRPDADVLLALEDGKATLPSVVFSTPKKTTPYLAARRWPSIWMATKAG